MRDGPLTLRPGETYNQPMLPYTYVGPVIDPELVEKFADERTYFQDGIEAGTRAEMSWGLALNTEERFSDWLHAKKVPQPFTITELAKTIDDEQWGEFATWCLAAALDRLSGYTTPAAPPRPPFVYQTEAEKRAERERLDQRVIEYYDEKYDQAHEPVVRDDGMVVRAYVSPDDDALVVLAGGFVVSYPASLLNELSSERGSAIKSMMREYANASSDQIGMGKPRLQPARRLLIHDL